MSGLILHNLPIAVDFWKVRQCSDVKLFFLSHMHSDHTVGLSSSWPRLIHCTAISKKLLMNKYHIHDAKIRALDVGASHRLALNDLDDVTVTLMDANHCPGACMFLFEGSFGRILYTGDFRYSGGMTTDDIFHDVIRGAPVDVLYIDNTFCSPHCGFPSQEEATQEILAIIRNHSDCRVMIGLHSLGKESLLVTIAVTLRVLICVTEERLNVLRLLEAPAVFTTDSKQTHIHVVAQTAVGKRQVQQWNEETPTIAILPTGLFVAVNSGNVVDDNIFVVKYSDHSSFDELCQFVSTVAPRYVHPILSSGSDRLSKALPERSDMSCFDSYLRNSEGSESKYQFDDLLSEIDRRELNWATRVKRTVTTRSRGKALTPVSGHKTRLQARMTKPKMTKPSPIEYFSSQSQPSGDSVEETAATPTQSAVVKQEPGTGSYFTESSISELITSVVAQEIVDSLWPLLLSCSDVAVLESNKQCNVGSVLHAIGFDNIERAHEHVWCLPESIVKTDNAVLPVVAPEPPSIEDSCSDEGEACAQCCSGSCVPCAVTSLPVSTQLSWLDELIVSESRHFVNTFC